VQDLGSNCCCVVWCSSFISNRITPFYDPTLSCLSIIQISERPPRVRCPLPYLIAISCILTRDIPLELLNDDYIFNTKVKVATSTGDGRTYTIAGATDPKNDDAIKADLQVKQKMGSRTLTTKLLTNGAATTELKLEKLGLEGLKTTLLFGVGKKVGECKVEYGSGTLGVMTSADYYNKKVKTAATCRLTTNSMKGFAVFGTEAGYDIESGELKGINSALSYFDGKESEITVHVFDKGAKGKVSYSHQVRPDFAVAGEMTYDREKDDTKLTMGVAAALDCETKIKGKLSSTGQLALTYLQVIRPKTTLILSTSFDVKEMKAPKFGLSLAIE